MMYDHMNDTAAWAKAQQYKHIIEQSGEETVEELCAVISKLSGEICVIIDSSDCEFGNSDTLYERAHYSVVLLEQVRVKDSEDRKRAIKAQKAKGREYVKHLFDRMKNQELPYSDIPMEEISMSGVGPLGTGNLYGVMIDFTVNEYLF